VPALLGNVIEPAIGIYGDTGRRRAVLLVGGLVFSLAIGLSAVAPGFGPLLIALIFVYPASTAFVSLSQASLMDLAPGERERNMARWTLAGSIGIVVGPLPIAFGAGWRATTLILGVAALALVVAASRLPIAASHEPEDVRTVLLGALRALRNREVARWLALLELVDLMLDVLFGFLALYFVDVVGVSAAQAALAVGVWTGAGLVGDALLLAVLASVSGLRYLRGSALAVTLVFPAFLLVEDAGAKLVLLALLGLLNAGWYAIPKAGLYSALPCRSGTAVAVGSVTGFAGALIPLGIGVLAGTIGLGTTMWLLLLAPLALLVGLPRER
jgi:MFS transporter, FSR family, fosmidomycin resistance protein